MKKRIVLRQSPDSKALREAMKLAHEHLDYIDYLLDNRPWLAGATMSLADLAAAAQISVADYLGGLDWSNHEQAKGWYGVFKSRPSFRPLLSERMEVIQPPSHYADVNW
jgi:glutathione S-transferase